MRQKDLTKHPFPISVEAIWRDVYAISAVLANRAPIAFRHWQADDQALSAEVWKGRWKLGWIVRYHVSGLWSVHTEPRTRTGCWNARRGTGWMPHAALDDALYRQLGILYQEALVAARTTASPHTNGRRKTNVYV